jgi:hypothetical protein
MIVTRRQLRQMISEELRVARSRRKGLTEARPSLGIAGEANLYDVEVSELIGFCKAYASMGNAIQEQLDDILDNSDNDDVNPNAIRVIEQDLGGMNQEIDNAIAAYNEYRNGEPAGIRDSR